MSSILLTAIPPAEQKAREDTAQQARDVAQQLAEYRPRQLTITEQILLDVRGKIRAEKEAAKERRRLF